MQEFENIKVGDVVTVMYYDKPYKITKVEKVNKLHFIVDGSKYKFNGYPRSSTWGLTVWTIKTWKPEHTDYIKLTNIKNKIKRVVEKIDELSIKKLEAIYEIIK